LIFGSAASAAFSPTSITSFALWNSVQLNSCSSGWMTTWANSTLDWAIVMEEGGHQIPHIHTSGWLSGVYYVDVPDEILADDPDHHGWLAFGRGDPRWHQESTVVAEHLVCPAGGLVATFPSFFWHETKPLRTSRRRISYAFDVIPAYPWKPES